MLRALGEKARPLSDTSDTTRLKIRTVQRLIRETGITEPQAHELIALLGPDWPSLVREARLIAKSNLGE